MKYGIIADVHSNLAALERVLYLMGEVDEVWCLGDIVGYGPEPNECLEIISNLGGRVIAGNHDLGAIGETSLDLFNVYAAEVCRWTGEVLDDEGEDYIRSLSRNGLRLGNSLLVHGSPRDPIWEYVLTLRQAAEIFRSTVERFIFVGHSHLPFVFRWRVESAEIAPLAEGKLSLEEDARFIINPGSVGQPRDGDPRASFMVFEPESGELEYIRVDYPVSVTQAKMSEAGLPQYLIERLSFGE